jgi:hypothetical protein
MALKNNSENVLKYEIRRLHIAMTVEDPFSRDVACYVTINFVIYVIQPLLAGIRNQGD